MTKYLTPAMEREIARRYMAGESSRQLAAAFDCVQMTILGALERQGVARRPRGGSNNSGLRLGDRRAETKGA